MDLIKEKQILDFTIVSFQIHLEKSKMYFV